MKKLYITIVLALGLAAGMNAQNVTYGIKAGVTLSDWSGDATQSISELANLSGVVGTSHNTGFHLGGFLVFPVNDKFSFEPGLVYSQKGMQLRETLVDVIIPIQAKAVVKSHYLDIPLLAKFQPAAGFQIFGGPQVSYLMDNRLIAKAGVMGFNVQESFNIDAGFRKVDVGLTGGMGYQFANGLNISASYEHGLSSIDESGFFDAYNQAVKASVGFVF